MERAVTEGGQLTGKRILVVEDEYFIASDIKRALQREDAVVVGPVGDLAKGLGLLDDQAVDAAVLDVNLEGDTSFRIAERLRARSVPYMFLTGYDGWALPEEHRSAPRIAKPFTMRAVVDCLGSLVASTDR